MPSPRYCSNCLAMSTRPRISFDERGWCNACQWMERKKTINWQKRKDVLEKLLDESRSGDSRYDCVVPVSGGKDGSYIAHQLKHVYGMNPLCVTVSPPLALPLGDRNLKNFIESGYSHMTINPSANIMRQLDKYGFCKIGFPYYGWLTAITTAPLQVASKFGISLVCYAEDGETEYGGSDDSIESYIKSTDYSNNILLSGCHEDAIRSVHEDLNGLSMFEFPKSSSTSNIKAIHWSYFENWDPYNNYLVAKKHCGLEEADEANVGTFTNFAQTDQMLYALHTYIMYLKFGFGRANQDACIEIRRGAMTREQAVQLVRLYDGQYPEEFINSYLDYYAISQSEFFDILDKYVNKDLFKAVGKGLYQPLFSVA